MKLLILAVLIYVICTNIIMHTLLKHVAPYNMLPYETSWIDFTVIKVSSYLTLGIRTVTSDDGDTLYLFVPEEETPMLILGRRRR